MPKQANKKVTKPAAKPAAKPAKPTGKQTKAKVEENSLISNTSCDTVLFHTYISQEAKDNVQVIGRHIEKNGDIKFDCINVELHFEVIEPCELVFQCLEFCYLKFLLLSDAADTTSVKETKFIELHSSKTTLVTIKEACHVVVIKMNDSKTGQCIFKGITTGKIQAEALDMNRKKMLFMGDSLTCGSGNEGDKDKYDSTCSYSALISQHYNAISEYVAIGGLGLIRNFGDNQNLHLPLIRTRKLAIDASTEITEPTKYDYVFINIGSNDYVHPTNRQFNEQFEEELIKLFSDCIKDYGNDVEIFYVMGPVINSNVIKGVDKIKAAFKQAQEKLGDHLHLLECHLDKKNLQLFGYSNHPSKLGHKILYEELLPQITKVIK